MASIGLNVARDGSSDPVTVRDLGATWVRIVAMAEHDLTDYLLRCEDQGLRVLLVLARESFADGGTVSLYRERYADLVDAVQVGNESDLVSPSSWTMAPGELAALGLSVRTAWPGIPIVCAGMASGHPEWMDGMNLSWADAVAVHPYLKDAPNPSDLEDLPDADALVREYGRFGKPVLVTEWGWWGDQEQRATEETRDMVRWAGSTDLCEVLFYFCYSDSMVPPFGLLHADGSEKPRAAAFREQAQHAIHSLWPTTRPAEPQPPAVDAWRYWTPEQLAATIRCPLASVRAHWPRLVEQLAHCGIDDRPVQAAMAGTVAIETAHRFEPIHEFRNPDGSIPAIWHTYDGGPEFHGRGFIQVTHRSNYARYGPKVAELWGAGGWEPDFDLVGDPDRALEPNMSAAIAALYFRDHGGDHLQLIPNAARRGDWREVRRLVQGADAGLADFTRYATALLSGAPPAPVDEAEALRLALRTLRDSTLPALRAQLDEADRIVRQFVGER